MKVKALRIQYLKPLNCPASQSRIAATFTALIALITLLMTPHLALGAIENNAALFQSMAEHSALNCADNAACPPSVGLLLYKIDNKDLDDSFGDPEYISQNTKQCTSVLLQPDLVLTAGHCVPKSIRYRGASCKDKIAIRFTTALQDNTYYGAEVAQCKEIVSVKKRDSEDAEDYAILRLNRESSRPTLHYSDRPIAHNELISLYKITPVDKTVLIGQNEYYAPAGKLIHNTCTVVKNSYTVPLEKDTPTPVETARDCEIKKGNSGAPVLNSRNEIIGLVNGYFSGFNPNETPDGPASQFISDNLISPYVNIISYWFNLSCVPGIWDGTEHKLPSWCSNIPTDEDFTRVQRNFLKSSASDQRNIEHSILTKVSNWVDSDNEALLFSNWKAQLTSSSSRIKAETYIPVPQCYNTEKMNKIKTQLADMKEKTFMLPLQRYPSYRVSYGLDEDYRFAYKTATKTESVFAVLNTETYELTIQNSVTDRVIWHEQLTACAPQYTASRGN